MCAETFDEVETWLGRPDAVQGAHPFASGSQIYEMLGRSEHHCGCCQWGERCAGEKEVFGQGDGLSEQVLRRKGRGARVGRFSE
jgi:hypothetical protein